MFGEDPTDGLDDTATMAEAKHSVSNTKSRKKICLSLYYNAINSFWYANGAKFYQFNAKDSEIKPYPLCLRNISKNFMLRK